jgi:hypothetical protein
VAMGGPATPAASRAKKAMAWSPVEGAPADKSRRRSGCRKEPAADRLPEEPTAERPPERAGGAAAAEVAGVQAVAAR